MRRYNTQVPSVRHLRSLLLACSISALLVGNWTFIGKASAQAVKMSLAQLSYGVQIDSTGLFVGPSIEIASSLGLDWLGIQFDWEASWPDPNTPPDLVDLVEVMEIASKRDLKILISITNPPSWAMTARGPDPALTAQLVEHLHSQFSNLNAIEPFPAANTTQGWGAIPDPEAYLQLVRQLQARFDPASIWIVAGGLTPLPENHAETDVDDIQFLEGLYAAGAQDVVQILSLHLSDLTGSPMKTPYGKERRVIRHYEIIRNVMLRNGHQEGVIWITSFSWPSGKIAVDDDRYRDPAHQAQWLHQAFNLLNAQLYIGVAIFDSLNPAAGDMSEVSQDHSLIRPNGSYHPGLLNLAQLTALDSNPFATMRQATQVKKIHSDKKRFKPFR